MLDVNVWTSRLIGRDRDTCLVSSSLRRISDEASHLASAPCVLPRAAVSRRP